jgi:5-methylcytosine-specific restriction endonuclease McrA
MGRKYAQVEARILKNHRSEALAEQGGCCKYCYAPLTVATSTADHKKARAKGGTNARGNIVAACVECNVAKGSWNILSFNKAIRNPEGHSFQIWRAWSRRRIWLATHRACRRIRYSVGLDNDTPIGHAA